MTSSKRITVLGATGAQGQSVVHSLLLNTTHNFSVRGITRNRDSTAAKQLANRGVDMVKGDFHDIAQMVEAFRGSWALFLNTLPHNPDLGGIREREVGMALVDAALEAGVQHLVYSGLPSALTITNGAVPSRDFDEKAAVSEYAKTKGFKTFTVVGPGYFLESIFSAEVASIAGGFPFTPDKDGFLTMAAPNWGGNEEMPVISMARDFGDIVHGIFLDPADYNGKYIQAFSDSATAERVVSAFEKVTGKKSRFKAIDVDSIETGGDADMEMYKSMYKFLQHSGGKYYGTANNISLAKELKAKAAAAKGAGEHDRRLTSVEEFIRKYFPTEVA